MAVAGESHIIINSNEIYGKSQSFTNVGLYIWNHCTSACSSNTLENNRVNYKNKSGVLNDFWNGSSDATSGHPAATATVWTNNVNDATLSGLSCPQFYSGPISKRIHQTVGQFHLC